MGFKVTVSAATLLDAVRAFGLLYAKTDAGAQLHLYTFSAVHAGAFAAAWMVCKVDIAAVAAAAAVATDGRELADLTLPEDCAARCTKHLEVISAMGNYATDNGLCVKRRFGSRRDVLETLAATTTLPSLFSTLMAPCTVSRVSALTAPAQLRALTGSTTEWDVCPSSPAAAPECFAALRGSAVEETIGAFFLTQL